MQPRSSRRIRTGTDGLPPTSSPSQLIEALQNQQPEARAQLWEQIRPLLERLIDQLIARHHLTVGRERLLTLALHAAETWVRTRPPGELAQASWQAFRAAVLLHVGKMALHPFGRQSMAGPAPRGEPAPLPEHPSYQSRTFFLPFEQVGTSWYGGDWVGGGQAGDGSLWVLLADITGHGYHAYLLATTLPSVWQKCWPAAGAGCEPADLLAAMHRLFVGCFPEGIYVECTLVRLARDGAATIAPAGGTRLLLRRAGAARAELVKLRGSWFGLCQPNTTEQRRCALAEGDELVLGTDGLFDQLGGSPAPDGGLPAAGRGPVFDQVQMLLHEALRQQPQGDDITMVSLRRLGPTERPAAAQGPCKPRRDG